MIQACNDQKSFTNYKIMRERERERERAQSLGALKNPSMMILIAKTIQPQLHLQPIPTLRLCCEPG